MLRLLVLVLGSSILIGCASFHGDELERLSPSELNGQELLPEVSYTIKLYGNSYFGSSGDPRARIEPLFRRAFREARELSEDDSTPEALHIDLLLRQTPRNAGLSFGLGLLWLGSLGLSPAYGRDDIYFDVRVMRGEETLEHYVYTEHLTTWLTIFVLPWSFTRDPENVYAEMIDNLILHFLQDLRRDLPRMMAPSIPLAALVPLIGAAR